MLIKCTNSVARVETNVSKANTTETLQSKAKNNQTNKTKTENYTAIFILNVSFVLETDLFSEIEKKYERSFSCKYMR